MSEISFKRLLTPARSEGEYFFRSDWTLNLYRGCNHGCVYCDSRSVCYHMEDFDRVRVKRDCLAALETELKAKKRAGTVSMGAASDAYNALESKLNVTRGALLLINGRVDVAIAVWPWGQYLGDDAAELGVDACVSSWRRSGLGSSPALAKATANYLNSQLVKMEAVTNGFAEGIALDDQGYVSEGSGENVFLVHEGQLLTPAVSSSILPGITRNSILRLAEEMGIPTRRESIPRGFLYTCDEAFFTGTAVEVTPIRSVDRIPVGEGKPGPITRRLMQEYLALTRGEVADRFGWLTPVPAAVAQVS